MTSKREKALIIYHRVDFDGVYSANIAKMRFEDLKYEVSLFGFQYGDPTLSIEELKEYGIIVMADITFPPEEMVRIKKSINTRNFYWIDHHETAIKDSETYGYSDFNGRREIGKGAVELCWEVFYPNIECPKIIKYLSTYDVFNKNRFPWDEEILPTQFALRAKYKTSVTETYPDFKDLISTDDLSGLIELGKIILGYQERNWGNAAKNYSFPITVAGQYIGIAMITTEFSSNVFNSIDKNLFDIMCVVNKIDEGYRMSLYVDPDRGLDFSVGKYLKETYGGGGHAGAAGCTLDEEQFIRLVTKGVV